MTKPCSIVILTGDGLEHKYVTNQICAKFPVSAVFVVSEPRRKLKTVLRRGFVRLLDKMLWKAYLFAVNDRKARTAALKKVLGWRCLEFCDSGKLVYVDGKDVKGLAQAVAEFRPTIIAVYGTHKIPDLVLSQASELALNMHTGLSPYYRGVACAFWPIVDNNPSRVGATVHECTSTIDGGQVYYTKSATMQKDDDLHSIFCRAVKVGAEGYIDVLNRYLSNNLVGQPQDLVIGREYRGYMRGLAAEMRARTNLKNLRKHWPADVNNAGERQN